jgi:uncharacterized protein
MFFHWSFVFVIPGLILGIWAQTRVKSAFKKYSQVRSMRGLKGWEAARAILDTAGLSDVKIEGVAGKLSDHYDPRSKVLRLSEGVLNSDSIAAIGIAAHEAGHAVQDQQKYAPFTWRSTLVPAANLGSTLLWPMVLIGFFLQVPIIAQIGVWLFTAAVLFHLVTLPVEFNASSRAMALISDNGILTQDETVGVKKVLNAAAMTYVAALAVAIGNLIQAFLISRD